MHDEGIGLSAKINESDHCAALYDQLDPWVA
jgi:hypothetical protein